MKDIFIFGDSNTWGMIPASEQRYPHGVRWTSRLRAMTDPNTVRIIDEGHNGRTTVFDDPLSPGRRGLDSLPVLLETHRPFDACILMLGTNDCKSQFSASADIIGLGLERCLDAIAPHVDAASTLLISPIAVGQRVTEKDSCPEFDAASIEKSLLLKDICREIAERRGLAYLAASDYANPSPIDGIHMTEEGHRMLADAVYHKLLEMGVLTA